ncbi:DUF1566 domain-containing protein [Bacteroidota bacterium]
MRGKIFSIILIMAACMYSSAQITNTVCTGTDVFLYASIPQASTVQWQFSSSGSNFTDIPSATNDTLELLNIQAGGYYRLKISGPECLPYFSEVNSVTVVSLPTPSNAGPDIMATSTSVQLNSNTPVVGSGSWAIISGTGGSFNNSSNPQAVLTGTLTSIYVLTWTISNAPCAASIDTVVVTMPSGPPLPSVTCGSNILYVHPTDNGSSVWGCSGFASGANDPNDGAYNTALVVQMCSPPTAALLCDTLVAFGYSDWYLPSYNELECLRVNAASIGGFSNTTYWSSSEGAGILYLNAYYRTFPSGVSGVGTKSTVRPIRCVRK